MSYSVQFLIDVTWINAQFNAMQRVRTSCEELLNAHVMAVEPKSCRSPRSVCDTPASTDTRSAWHNWW